MAAGTYFNPHSREGSDAKQLGVKSDFEISIHTPAKGVTNLKGLDIVCVYISIHTPAKGVTFCILSVLNNSFYFNPHSREGSDGGLRDRDGFPVYFNPHSREGSDGSDRRRD